MRGDVKRSKGQFTYRTRVDFGKITFLGTQIYCLAKSAVLPMAPPTVVDILRFDVSDTFRGEKRNGREIFQFGWFFIFYKMFVIF